ncbi:LysR family transcriptional regulator [Hydrogenophaga sp. A37]|nr:LysR family transcriptional regulator [Hydrogenophaga sp. A37]
MRLISNIHMTNIETLDLNLLRVFDAIYRTRNISRAAEQLGLSQPATSQALTRLRLVLRDPIFERAMGGVRPTERADRLARSVQAGMALFEAGLQESDQFDPLTSTEEVRLHLTDIGEARFLPKLMAAMEERAPHMQLQARAWPPGEVAAALDTGQLHIAIGFLPAAKDTAKEDLLTDRYALLLRADHPITRYAKSGSLALERLNQLHYVAVRSHTDTLRILQMLHLEHQVRLVTSTFLALPAIVRSTDLGVLMPREIAQGFAPAEGFCLLEPRLPLRDFTVALHWSRRYQQVPMQQWLRALVIELFKA